MSERLYPIFERRGNSNISNTGRDGQISRGGGGERENQRGGQGNNDNPRGGQQQNRDRGRGRGGRGRNGDRDPGDGRGRGRGGGRGAFRVPDTPMRAFRLRVIETTIKILTVDRQYTAPSGKQVTLDPTRMERNADRAMLYETAPERSVVNGAENPPKPMFRVVKGDCLTEGIRLKEMGYNPVVLNMASNSQPGGGYLSGAGAQEENLFRRSNLYQYHEPHAVHWYPLAEFGGIYCPDAVVFRDEERKDYAFMEEPVELAFVAVAALKSPRIVWDSEGVKTLTEHDCEKTEKKIRAILNIGLANHHDAIVLSAFGCGAYGNPARTVARLFYEVISREYMDDPRPTYRCISFAIFDDSNANMTQGTEGNFLPFWRRFKSLSDVEDMKIDEEEAQDDRPAGSLLDVEDMKIDEEKAQSDTPAGNLPDVEDIKIDEDDAQGGRPAGSLSDVEDIKIDEEEAQGDRPAGRLSDVEDIKFGEEDAQGGRPAGSLSDVENIKIDEEEAQGDKPAGSLSDVEDIKIDEEKVQGDRPAESLSDIKIGEKDAQGGRPAGSLSDVEDIKIDEEKAQGDDKPAGRRDDGEGGSGTSRSPEEEAQGDVPAGKSGDGEGGDGGGGTSRSLEGGEVMKLVGA